MRITYVARSFLDYRVPVLSALRNYDGVDLNYITSSKWTPQRVLQRLRDALGEGAHVLDGEWSLGDNKPIAANKSINISFQPGLVSAIRQTKPDVLVADGFFRWTPAALWVRATRGTPLVVCYERWSHTERAAQWYRRLYRKLALRLVDAASCNGVLSADYMVSIGFPREKITLGHQAAEVDEFSRAADALRTGEIADLRSSWGNPTVAYLYVGRLIPMKGLAELLEGWVRIRSKNSSQGAVLVIVGSGPEQAALQRLSLQLGLDNVVFAGQIDHDALPLVYAASDIFVIPTLEDNWSLVVPEAMACGKPIACSVFNGCWQDLVMEGVNGWVFDPLDSDSVRAMLDRSLDAQNRGMLAAMGSESRRIVAQQTPAHAARAIYEACRIAMANRGGQERSACR